MTNFWIDIGFSVLFAALRDKKVLGKYSKAFIKLRDALNVAFPVDS